MGWVGLVFVTLACSGDDMSGGGDDAADDGDGGTGHGDAGDGGPGDGDAGGGNAGDGDAGDGDAGDGDAGDGDAGDGDAGDGGAGDGDAGDGGAGDGDAGDGAVNMAPTADAGADASGFTHLAFSLDGSGSSDPEDDGLTYDWELKSAPAGSTALLSDAATASPGFVPDLPGAYVFSLVVGDGTLDSAADEVTVTVSTTKVLVVGDNFAPGLTDRIVSGLGWEVDSPYGFNAFEPVASGSFVAWEQNAGGPEVLVAEGSGGRIEVAPHGGQIAGIHASGDRLVFSNNRALGTSGDIYAYTISTGVEVVIANTSHEEQVPQTDGDWVVWHELILPGYTDRNIRGYRISDGATFDIDDPEVIEEQPELAGDYVVYQEEDLSGEEDIYGYRISTGTRFPIDTTTGLQNQHQAAGDYALWFDRSSGTPTLKSYRLSDGMGATLGAAIQFHHDGTHVAYTREEPEGTYNLIIRNLSTGSESTVATGSNYLLNPWVETPFVAWTEQHPTDGADVMAYDFDTTQSVALASGPGTQDRARVIEGRFYWTEGVQSDYAQDVFVLATPGGQKRNLSGPGSFRVSDAIEQLDRYRAIVFGDNIDSGGGLGVRSGQSLALLDAADSAGVPMLALNSDLNDTCLAHIFDNEGLYGIGVDSVDATAIVAIDVSVPGHPIFEGLSTGSTLALHTGSSSVMEEFVATLDGAALDAPSDWTTLAVFGPAGEQTGKDAIVTFSLPMGTLVMMDGTGDLADRYMYWNAARETLYLNQVRYLAGLPR